MVRNEFKCEKCGCKNLSYQKYVKCLADIEIDENGNIHYEQSIIDEDNWVAAEFGFVCRDCGDKFYHAGEWLEAEDDLIQYLTTDPEILAEEQKLFDESVAEECERQSQEDKELAEYYVIF